MVPYRIQDGECIAWLVVVSGGVRVGVGFVDDGLLLIEMCPLFQMRIVYKDLGEHPVCSSKLPVKIFQWMHSP